ncbi:MAG: hypothetical protein ACTSSO_03665, partial [Candidatus Hodarchaeales archaeon]
MNITPPWMPSLLIFLRAKKRLELDEELGSNIFLMSSLIRVIEKATLAYICLFMLLIISISRITKSLFVKIDIG